MLSVPSRFNTFPDFLKFLIPALNGTVGFWATVSLNIPDFTRFARNQREQVIGQALALPTTMTLYAFVGIVVTSATVVIYGTAIWDPVQLLSRFHSPVAVVISLVAILLATLNVNIGANVVSPANDFSNLWPRGISFRTGGVITCFMGIALMPWKLLANYRTFILGWLGGYAAFLGPVAGIMICDYFVIRRRVLRVDDLYLRGGVYEYSRGFNWCAVIALALGAGTALAGLAVPYVRALYDYSWFVGFAVSFVAYYAMMKVQRQADCSAGSRVTSPLCLPCFQELRHHVALVNLQRLLFLPAHQINVELGNTHIRQFPQFLAMGLDRTDQAKPVHDFIRDKVCVITFDFAMVLIIMVATILHKRSQRRRQILGLVLADQVHYMIRNQSGEPTHSFASDAEVIRSPHGSRCHYLDAVWIASRGAGTLLHETHAPGD